MQGRKAVLGRNVGVLGIWLCLSIIVGGGVFLVAADSMREKLSSSLSVPVEIEIHTGVWGKFKSLLNAQKGDKHDMIPQLKRYFARFGYLNLTQGQNVTADFDEDLEGAIRLYQQIFGLSVTGAVNVKTLEQIMLPRCGREDVIAGVPVMLQKNASGAVPKVSGEKHEVHVKGVKHFAFFPGNLTWTTTRNLAYAFSPAKETTHVSETDRRTAFSRAFSDWAAVVPITFTEIKSYDIADVRIEFDNLEHGDGQPFDGVLGILAHTFAPTDGRMHLDDAEYWTVNVKTSNNVDAIDLQSVAVHEIGHLIGLAHTSVQDAVMYPSIKPRQVKHQLSQDDIQGAQSLYGKNPSYNPNNPLPGTDSSNQATSSSSCSIVKNAIASSATKLFFTLLITVGLIGIIT